MRQNRQRCRLLVERAASRSQKFTFIKPDFAYRQLSLKERVVTETISDDLLAHVGLLPSMARTFIVDN